jgi:filamentous hemagglutinin family protein
MLLMTSALAPLTVASATAGPNGATVVGGSATVQGQGTANVVVNQTSQSAVINWNTFNIGAGETTRINMPSASSVELDRVTGGLGPSQILGSLSSNGQVFLVNPDGFLFGAGARINVGGLLATTNDISNADFMAGKYNFNIPGNPSASIVNQGSITAQTGGFAALVAPGVRNTGTITANLGTIALASGNAFTLDLYGDNLITLGLNDSIASQVIDVSTGKQLSSLVSNAGTLKANGGKVQLTAVAARQVVDSVINNTGVIEANTIGTHKGMIVLGAATAANKPAGAPKQTVKVSGTLSAAGKKKGTTGGTIVVTGENVQLSGAAIDASGVAGGGAVLIGGDWGGGRPNTSLVFNPSAYLEPFAVPTASTVSIDATTAINASATTAGNGGKVIIWSNDATTFYGTILARGGPRSGNGGFVETSGHQLTFNGAVNTGAPNGQLGTWLLDPTNLTVNAAAAATISQSLGNTNVILQTNANGTTLGPGNTSSGPGDIIVDAPITWNSIATLTLNAYSNIELNGSISGGLGGLIINAGNSITATAAVNVGNFTLQNGAWSQISSTLPTFHANNFQITGGSFLRALGGNGTNGSPYQIADVYGLQGIGSSPTLLAASYVLANNVEASGTASWNGGAGFVPIGNGTTNFNGTFNGAGYTISNLTMNLPTTSYIGFFGYTGSGATIESVGLINASVAGLNFVGALVGLNNGAIRQSYATGIVEDHTTSCNCVGVGGLVGSNYGTISQSYATATVVTGAGSYSTTIGEVGGLVGINYGSIMQSHATGVVNGNGAVGGLVGANYGDIANQSYATGSVIGNAQVGGLVGHNLGTISQSYATGNLSGFGVGGSDWVGGFVGFNDTNGSIESSYATGAVNGSGNGFGGLVGENWGSIANSWATGPVNASGSVGGLVGSTSGGTITRSYATGSVVGYADVGGLVGTLSESGSLVTQSYATGSVTGTAEVGGLIGFSQNGGTVQQSYATGSVSGTTAIGGLVGVSDSLGTITQSYATGAVSGGTNVGGLVGFNEGTVSQTYAIGWVTGGSLVGGLIGYNSGAVTASYWDTQTSGQNASAGGTPISDGNLKAGLPTGFDQNVWGTNHNGYPYLKWQIMSTATPIGPANGSSQLALLVAQDLNEVEALGKNTLYWAESFLQSLPARMLRADPKTS